MRLLIVGTGSMAARHAQAFTDLPGVEVVAAVDVRPDVLSEFCAKHNIEHSFSDVAQALDWGEFDAVTVVTPDQMHKDTSLPFIEAGKHVLCEKPLAPNYTDASEMADVAEKAGVVAMVQLTYRSAKALTKGRELVLAGKIGEVRHIEASYLQSWLLQDGWGDWRTEPRFLWRVSTKHGSLGTLGDTGIHLVDFACHGSNLSIEDVHCRLKTFHKAPGDKIGEYILDANDSAMIDVSFNNGALGTLHVTRMAAGHYNDMRLRVYGTQGAIEINCPDQYSNSTIRACLGMENMRKVSWEDIEAPEVPDVFECFVSAVRGEKPADPTFRHAANLQKVLDLAFESASSGKNLPV